MAAIFYSFPKYAPLRCFCILGIFSTTASQEQQQQQQKTILITTVMQKQRWTQFPVSRNELNCVGKSKKQRVAF